MARRSRFAHFDRKSAALWLIAAAVASVAVLLWPPGADRRPPEAVDDTGNLVFFELDDAADAGPSDAAPAPEGGRTRDAEAD